jgi:hypothetical protein
MIPQLYTPADHYATVSRWYEGHCVPVPESDTLVDGIVIPGRGAIFFYDDPRSPALLAYFIVTNPEFPHHAEETIAQLILHSEEAARLRKKRMIFSFSGKPALAARFADAGWEYLETTILTAKSWPSQH